MSNVRILIVAGNLLARTGLAALLSAHPDLDVVGQVAGSDSLADDLNIYRPDVVVYDLGYEPPALLPRLAMLVDALLPVVALLPDTEFTAATLSALAESSVYGLLLRDSDAELLAGALVAVANGLVVIDPLLADALVPVANNVPPEPPTEDLTPREFDVLQLMAEGLPNKAIAQTLEISPNTVKFHVNAILSKLGAQSRTEAVVRATQLGLIVL